ncbi:hypothetical protein [Gandjariella thermophila]|uniref:DUF3137 domain-containing protein n=1 Tax=Gandjariella thermophila TaxID=1931992 RepID=A0A4D4J6B5_9PSEU|nr:hypothetical protein [Gandjariella thermophila]GDY30642.1 hypothetical protein GTS_22750 [Gandjariella thermophila]
MDPNLLGSMPLAAGSSNLAPFVPIAALVVLGIVGRVVVRSRKGHNTRVRPGDLAERYRAAGVHYTSPPGGFGTPTGQPLDHVEGIRHGVRFTAFRRTEQTGFTFHVNDPNNSMGERNFTSIVRVSIPLAQAVPPLRITERTDKERDSYRAFVSDVNAGAVATGILEFDDRFLVRCSDLGFVRRIMGPELAGWLRGHHRTTAYTDVSGPLSGIEFAENTLSVEQCGHLEPDLVFPALDFLVEMLSKVPPELVPPREAAAPPAQGAP